MNQDLIFYHRDSYDWYVDQYPKFFKFMKKLITRDIISNKEGTGYQYIITLYYSKRYDNKGIDDFLFTRCVWTSQNITKGWTVRVTIPVILETKIRAEFLFAREEDTAAFKLRWI